MSMRLLFVLMVLCGVVRGLAQTDEDLDWDETRWHVGLRAGYIELEDVDEDGSYNLGLMLGRRLNPYFTIEGSLDFQTADFYLGEQGQSAQVVLIERETFALQLGLNLTLLPHAEVRPFLSGGVGFYQSRYTSDLGPRDDEDDGGYHVGGGLEWLVHESFAFVAEGRWLFTQEEDGGDRTARADGFTTSLGARIRF